MAAEPRYELRIDMASTQATELLERVASDKDFRSELESNPAEALAEYGISAKGFEGAVSLPSPVAGLPEAAEADRWFARLCAPGERQWRSRAPPGIGQSYGVIGPDGGSLRCAV